MVLIKLAQKIINSNFTCDEAMNIKTDKRYDFVVSHSVFHYFNSLDYAKQVITKMHKKANKAIAIFDINDKSKEKEYHKIRMADMDEEEYKLKYSGLEHMFYDKNWFKELADSLNCKIKTFDQTFEKYSNYKLRFNVIMEKR